MCLRPTAIPHRSTEDDVHAGYYLPKGTIVIPNIWRMLHDPETYPDPLQLILDRFIRRDDGKLDCTHRDPVDLALGFGRR